MPVAVAMRLPLRSSNDLMLLVGAHPELRGRNLDVVDEEHLALAAGREVRKHGAGGEHVEAAANQRLEDFEAGVELAQLKVEPLLLEGAAVHAGPDLAVDRDGVEIADTHLGLGLRDRGRCGGEGPQGKAARSWSKLSAIHRSSSIMFDYSENETGAHLRLLGAVLVHHELA